MRCKLTAAVAASLACHAAQAAVTAAPAPTVLSDLSAGQMFALADRAVENGAYVEAETLYRALAKDPDIDVRSEARYRLARMLSSQKRYADAAVALRAILDEQPKAQRVRLELARILALMGDQRAALKQLRQTAAGDLPPDIAMVVRRVTQAYRSLKPIGLSMELALAPDSNINRATRAETLDTVIAPLELSRDARERSGLGFKASGQAYARVPLAHSLNGLVRLTGQASLYREAMFNDVAASAYAGLEWSRDRLALSPSAGRSYRWFGGSLYATTDSAQVNLRRSLGPKAQIEIDFNGGYASYRQNPLQSGPIFTLSFGYERALSQRSGGSITVSGERQQARDPGYATVSRGLALGYWREAGKLTLFGSANIRRLDGDARLLLFANRRRETYWRVGAGATFRQAQLGGFAPVLRVSHERNSSTVPLYDYRRNAVEIGVTRAF